MASKVPSDDRISEKLGVALTIFPSSPYVVMIMASKVRYSPSIDGFLCFENSVGLREKKRYHH